jgi:hypothetical protein
VGRFFSLAALSENREIPPAGGCCHALYKSLRSSCRHAIKFGNKINWLFARFLGLSAEVDAGAFCCNATFFSKKHQ